MITADIDVAALRSRTPGYTGCIHFNTAGAGLPSAATLATITEHLRREAFDGPMEAAASVQETIEEVRADAAALIGATPSEVAFASSGSAAWGLAFAALPPLEAGDRILVGRHEWGGNLATITAAARRAGAQVETIPCRDDGAVDANALARMIDGRVRLVSLTWLPANGGLVNDAEAVGRVTRAAGIPYFVDAGQAVGQIPVDVGALGCDVLKTAGRKHLRGPRGTAILYIRANFQQQLSPIFLDVLSAPWNGDQLRPRTDARLFETSEVSTALLLGLGSALREALSTGSIAIASRVVALGQTLRTRLASTENVNVQDLGKVQSGLVSFTVSGMEPADVRTRLAAQRIAVAANGAAYTPLDMTARGLSGVVRASVSPLTTEDELDQLVDAVGEISRAVSRARA